MIYKYIIKHNYFKICRHTKLNYLTSPLQYEEKSKKEIFQICITAIIKRSLYCNDLIE